MPHIKTYTRYRCARLHRQPGPLFFMAASRDEKRLTLPSLTGGVRPVQRPERSVGYRDQSQSQR